MLKKEKKAVEFRLFRFQNIFYRRVFKTRLSIILFL